MAGVRFEVELSARNVQGKDEVERVLEMSSPDYSRHPDELKITRSVSEGSGHDVLAHASSYLGAVRTPGPMIVI